MNEQLSLFAPEAQVVIALFGGPWAVWTEEHNCWFVGFEAELAAKYFLQGCAIRLAIADELTERPPTRPPEADPQEPPFDDSDIVWWHSAAQFAPESYMGGWEKIAAWLRTFRRHPRPEDIADDLARRIGRWAGGYDLESNAMENRLDYRVGRSHVRPLNY